MRSYRLVGAALCVVMLLMLTVLAIPFVRQIFFAASTPRVVQPRGDLSNLEKSTIELFEHASPSVVQIVAVREGRPGFRSLDDPPGMGSGTGFLWDLAGNIVTNAHVVNGARQVAIRTASGSTFASRSDRRGSKL